MPTLADIGFQSIPYALLGRVYEKATFKSLILSDYYQKFCNEIYSPIVSYRINSKS